MEVSQPVFIVGAARSGTTLLRMILDAHSELSICGELHFYDQIRQLRRDMPVFQSRSDLDRAERFIRRTVAFQLLESAPTVLQGAMAYLEGALPCPFDRLHEALLRSYSAYREDAGSRCGEKTPANVRYLNEIVQRFPEASFIHLVRDPRAVAASSIKVDSNSRDVLIHALTWRCDAYAARKFIESNSGRITEVRYEDLVADPRGEAIRLAEFLGFAFEEQMLRFHRDADQKIRMQKEPWKAGATEPIHASSVHRWQEELGPEKIRLVEMVAGRFLLAFGYSPWQDTGPSNLAVIKGIMAESRKYISAKLASRSPVEGAKDVVVSDTSILRRLLLRSLFDGP